MKTKKKIAIIGGGASGVGLAWCLTSQPKSSEEYEITLLHDEDELGGHSRTIAVWFDDDGKGHATTPPLGKQVYPVDIGVQFVCPSLYPNLYKQLQLPEFKNEVKLKRHAALKISGAFNDDICWGNFNDYQKGERFENCFDETTQQHAKMFERDLHRALLGRVNGKRLWNMKVGDYLVNAGIPQDSNFVRYLLIPYLCIINGYGTTDLYETTFTDLFPIFTRLPFVQDAGPYGSFLQPGYGWDRFEDGSTEWVLAMARHSKAKGANLHTHSTVQKVTPHEDGATVEWQHDTVLHGVQTKSEKFDVVVLTTDMSTNRSLLNHRDNPVWKQQADYITHEKFTLIPGVCYIHQDETLLAPCLLDGKEDGQFTGAFAWGSDSPESQQYDLPYDLRASFQTYFMDNILGTPHRCYVSMYAEDDIARRPKPETVVFKRTWRHGRWVASFFRKGKEELHKIQGVGNIYFGGNNTTIDSEEGALLSAMILAEKISSFKYPFAKISFPYMFYRNFRKVMLAY
jgi:hypothetical protein